MSHLIWHRGNWSDLHELQVVLVSLARCPSLPWRATFRHAPAECGASQLPARQQLVTRSRWQLTQNFIHLLKRQHSYTRKNESESIAKHTCVFTDIFQIYLTSVFSKKSPKKLWTGFLQTGCFHWRSLKFRQDTFSTRAFCYSNQIVRSIWAANKRSLYYYYY